MKSIETHGAFEQAISDSSPQVQEIARALRGLITDIYPEVVEVPWPKQRIVGYGVGPKKMTEHFCYIGTFSKHVNLGFYYGSFPFRQPSIHHQSRHVGVAGCICRRSSSNGDTMAGPDTPARS